LIHLKSTNAKEHNSNFPKEDMYLHLISNYHNSIQKQTKVNLNVSIMHTGETLISTTIGMKLYHRHTLNSVMNTTKTSWWCGLCDTWIVHYNSNFKTTSSSHIFWWKLSRLVWTLSTAILLENWQANFPSPNCEAHAE